MTESVSVALKFPHLYPKQAAFVNDPARYTVCFASTKSGKSVGLLCWLLGRAWQIGKDGRDFHWVAPTYPVAKIMYLRMQRWLRRADSEQLIWQSNDSELYIRLVNGARIHFKGGDRPDTLYGPDSWGVVIDEGTRVREEVWYAVRTIVTKTEAPVKIIGNMRGRKNWMYHLYQRGLAGDERFSSHVLTAYDAVDGCVVSLQEVEDAKAVLPEAVFRELYLAEPSDDQGNPFGLAAIAACVGPLSAAEPVVWGWDLAKSVDWTVGVGLDASGAVCRFDRFQRPWRETTETIRRQTHPTPALIDSTGVGDPIVESLQRSAGRDDGGALVLGARESSYEGFKFSQSSKQQLMEGLAVAIQQQEVRFPDGPIRNELEAFEYVYGPTGVKYRAPEGMHDDCVMALALAVRLLKLRPPPAITVEIAPAPLIRRSFGEHTGGGFTRLRV